MTTHKHDNHPRKWLNATRHSNSCVHDILATTELDWTEERKESLHSKCSRNNQGRYLHGAYVLCALHVITKTSMGTAILWVSITSTAQMMVLRHQRVRNWPQVIQPGGVKADREGGHQFSLIPLKPTPRLLSKSLCLELTIKSLAMSSMWMENGRVL